MVSFVEVVIPFEKRTKPSTAFVSQRAEGFASANCDHKTRARTNLNFMIKGLSFGLTIAKTFKVSNKIHRTLVRFICLKVLSQGS